MVRFYLSSIPVVLLAGLAACGARPAESTAPLTDPERAAVADTLRHVAREASRLFDSDLDCDEITDRLAADFGTPASFVAQGRIFDPGGRDEQVRLCRTIKRDRLSAREDVHEQRVEVLGRDAAVVVTRGVYTVHRTDGSTMVRSQVVTTAWSRGPEGWRMVHLHESWPAEAQAAGARRDSVGG